MKEELKVESEQKALDVLDAIRESKGITQAELGRRAFPDDAAGWMLPCKPGRGTEAGRYRSGRKERKEAAASSWRLPRSLRCSRRRPDPGAYKGVGRLLVKLVLTLF